MSLQVVYCNYQTTELDLRERLAFATSEQLSSAYQQLRALFPSSEAVVLSTCNRVEVYTAQDDLQEAPTRGELADFFSRFHGIPVDEFCEGLSNQSGPEVARHLFRVCSSVDSMVLGEPQIVSQVKQAYRVAEENDACGPLTNALFQGAIRVSKRVRSETRLAEGRVSVASVAVGEFARGIFERFDDKSVLVIGAGEMAEEALQYLQQDGVGEVWVVNRTQERAEVLAGQWGGKACRFEDLAALIERADVIISATSAVDPLVELSQFSEIRQRSGDRPVFILDLGTPRDFEPAIGDVDENVFLYDVDALQETCDRNRRARSGEIEQALSIIDDETDRFMQEVYHRATGPIIKQLREQWREVSDTELQRLRGKLVHLPEEDLGQIEQSVQRIVNKLLHPPLETLKDEAREGAPHGLLDALKQLFHIKD